MLTDILRLISQARWHCKTCSEEMAFHSKRMREHELICPGLTNGDYNKLPPSNSNLEKGQQTLNIPMMTMEEQHILDELFAQVCYEEGLSFSVFESPAMKRALYRLNPAFEPPTRQAISGPLLDSAYNKLKDEVDEILNKETNLNIITDESSNINKSRIANISVNTQFGTFYLLSEDLGAMRSTSTNMANWLEQHLLTLTQGNLQRISSIATDTCQTMLTMWEELRTKPSLTHIIVTPCDSHGIQLLIQDLIKHIPLFKTTHEDSQMVAKAFKNAHLQYARLHECQDKIYNKQFAIILAAATRWGTELGLYDGLYRSKEAIQMYGMECEAGRDMPVAVLQIILSPEFWNNLEKLRFILRSLNEKLKMSESNEATLAKVFPRWNEICEHLEKMKAMYPVPGFNEFMSMERYQPTAAYPRGEPKGAFLHRYYHLTIIC